jgi:prepilin-type processing-associated H-X9-DG protein
MPGGSRASPQRPAHAQHVHERDGGGPGELTNYFNARYVRFFKNAQVRSRSSIFVFLDELADTLNDGFFVNRLDDYAWGNVPGSYYDGGANFSFADGHLEPHRWLVHATIPAVTRRRIDKFPRAPVNDFEWLKARTSVKKSQCAPQPSAARHQGCSRQPAVSLSSAYGLAVSMGTARRRKRDNRDPPPKGS